MIVLNKKIKKYFMWNIWIKCINEKLEFNYNEFAKENDYELDITDTRLHHEIYLSNPRKCDVCK